MFCLMSFSVLQCHVVCCGNYRLIAFCFLLSAIVSPNVLLSVIRKVSVSFSVLWAATIIGKCGGATYRGGKLQRLVDSSMPNNWLNA